MKKGVGQILVGTVLIVVQLMSVMGTIKSGNYLPGLCGSGIGFLYDCTLFVSYYIIGIIGSIVLISGIFSYKKYQDERYKYFSCVEEKVEQEKVTPKITYTNEPSHEPLPEINNIQTEEDGSNRFIKVLSIIAAAIVVFGVALTAISDEIKNQKEIGYRAGFVDGKDSGFTEGYELGYKEGYEAGHKDGYKTGYNEMKPVTMPANGEILAGKETKWASEITISASYGSSHVVSLKTSDGKDVVTFFVRSGCSVTVGVPAKKMYVYFASGEKWYGYEKGKMFGKETSYTKDRDLLDFSRYTYSYTLHPVSGGNFSESPSNASEFF